MKNKLTIFHENTEVKKLDRGTESISFNFNNDYMYIGYYKPVNTLYFELDGVYNTGVNVKIERFINGNWIEIEHDDETDGFQKSGFIYIENAKDSRVYTHNNKEMHFIRIKIEAVRVIKFKLIDLIFCNARDLKLFVPEIEEFYPKHSDSHILSLIASRDIILRDINNAGLYTYNNIDVKEITQFDLLQIKEVREVAIYHALSLIYSNLSDADNDDIYWKKYNQFKDLAYDKFKIFRNSMLTIDLNENGVKDKDEVFEAISVIRLTR